MQADSDPAGCRPNAPRLRRAERRRALAGVAALLAGGGPAAVLAAAAQAEAAESSASADAAAGRRLRVGPGQAIATIAEAARLARDGDTVDIIAGDYSADVAVWRQDRLTIRAVGGRARLRAGGASAEGKAIWVVRGGRITVDDIDFADAAVPDRNGAGIRFEAGALALRNCRFIDNEIGLLTANGATLELLISDCEFAYNGAGDRANHNLYIGAISRLTFIGSTSRDGRSGHLLKSRAATSLIAYSRLVDSNRGTASYELEFPNGGQALVIGSLIRQAPGSENPAMVAYGAEGLRWAQNTLLLVNNTLVDDRAAGGQFVNVRAAPRRVLVVNNLWVGRGSLPRVAADDDWRNNLRAEAREFADPAALDYRLRKDSALAGRWVDPGAVDAAARRPERELTAPRGSRALPAGRPLQVGALHELAR